MSDYRHDVHRIYNVVGAIDGSVARSGFSGDVDAWVDALAGWSLDLGFDTFIFWPTTSPIDQLKRFTSDVVPATQKRIQDSRTGPRRTIMNDKPISSGHRNREEMHA